MTQQYWNSERLTMLRALWAEGFTCSAIAKRMGTTDNAVASARNKYGLPQRRAGRFGHRRGLHKMPEAKPKALVKIAERAGWPTKAQFMAGR